MNLIDTHCHLDHPSFSTELGIILQRAANSGVTDFVVPGCVAKSWDTIIALSSQYSHIHPAPGLHPLYLTHHHEKDLIALEQLCCQKIPIAIGEIGLDFYHHKNNELEQRTLFKRQVNIANEHNLPILLHVRKAHDQVQSIISKGGFTKGGIVHAFNGSRQQADKYIELGFKLGYGGRLTYPTAKRIRTLAAELPLSSIVLETDAPDMPLFCKQDEKNSPEYLSEIFETLAELRHEDRVELAKQLNANVKEVLPLISKQ